MAPGSIVPLSILDVQWPGDLADLLSRVEEMGYRRYWATEHHHPRQSASPTLVTALAAGLTEKMRVGTAGVLLRLSSAMRVAEDFAVLQLYFPGRLDLGIAGAGAGALYEERYASDVMLPDAAAYEDRLRRLVALVRGGMDSDRETIPVGPNSQVSGQDQRPELWLCGTGAGSAAVAGTLGLRFAYHQYLATVAGRGDPVEVIGAYRAAFVPHGDCDAPYVAVAGYGSCAPTLTEASAEWRSHFEQHEPPSPTFLGTPEACADALSELAVRSGADEIVLDCLMSSFAARLSGLDLLARTFR